MSELETFSKEDIRFEFEDFLEDHEQQLPEGVDPYFFELIQVLESPFRKVLNIPRALAVLPINAFMVLPFWSMLKIFFLLFAMAIPGLVSYVYVGWVFNRTAVVGLITFFVIIGALASPIYMRMIFSNLNNLVESRKAPWLVDEIKPVFDDIYQSNWGRQRRILLPSMIVPLLFDLKMLLLMISANQNPITFISSTGETITRSVPIAGIITNIILLVLSYPGFVFLFYITLTAFLFVIRNTRIYDMLLVKIIDRVKGYTEGHESIFTRKNYEVVKVLSDAPGLSIRSLSDIPQLGLLSSMLVFISTLFLLIAPYLIDGGLTVFVNNFPEIKNSQQVVLDQYKLTWLIVFGVAISALASFGLVLMPLIRISRVMGRFKNKALMELDPFLFDEITTLTLKREAELSNETQILFMLRSYIYTMKIVPVPPLRLVYLVAISVFYGMRIIPLIISIFGGGA